MDNLELVPVGTYVTSFNQWRNFKTTVFSDQFKSLSFDEVCSLRKGDTVYVEAIEYPHGKVESRIKVTVTKIDTIDMNNILIHYDGIYQSSEELVNINKETPFEVAVDESRLADLIKSLPESAIWGLHE